jgi:virginiamycin B lyase
LSDAKRTSPFRSSGEAIRRLHSVAIAIIAFGITQAAPARAQSTALTGVVSSAAEPVMEGVLVSARKDGSTVTVTVVSDDKGRYSFPADRLEPGHYAVAIRAIGYKLDGPKAVDLTAGATATADLKLSTVKNLAPQLSSGEWLDSLPGEPKQKAFLTMCVGCHTLQRVLTATHSAEEYEQVFLRMSRYSPGSTPTHPQPLLPGPRGERPAVTGDAAKAAAAYLASLTLGNADATEYAFKPLPRPKGRATRVIVTEYDLPRKEAMPHDVIVDADGKAWYSDFGSQFVGVLEPKTGKVETSRSRC